MSDAKEEGMLMISVLVEKLETLSFDAVKNEVKKIYPDVAEKMTGSDLALFSIDKTLITCIEIPAPISLNTLNRAIAFNERRLPTLKNEIAKHKANITISIFSGEAQNHLEALKHASFLTVIAAAISALTKTCAIYWPAGEHLNCPDDFRQYASGMKENRLPLELWLQLIPLTIEVPPEMQEKDVDQSGAGFGKRAKYALPQRMMLTEGLRTFIGREIEFASCPNVSHEDMAVRIMSFANELIRRGPLPNDGMTFGLNEKDSMRVLMKPEGVRNNIPVISLVPENIVPGLIGVRK